MIIPVITGASGIVTKSLKEKCGSHIGKIFNRFATKTAILGSSHIIRKKLHSET
jgi:hypothetical protein